MRTLFYSLNFEKTALREKSTFQPPVNVSEFGLWFQNRGRLGVGWAQLGWAHIVNFVPELFLFSNLHTLFCFLASFFSLPFGPQGDVSSVIKAHIWSSTTAGHREHKGGKENCHFATCFRRRSMEPQSKNKFP